MDTIKGACGSWWCFVKKQTNHATRTTNTALAWTGNFQIVIAIGLWAFTAWAVALGLPALLSRFQLVIPFLESPYWRLTVGFVLFLIFLEVGAKGAWQEEHERADAAVAQYEDATGPAKRTLTNLKKLVAEGEIRAIEINRHITLDRKTGRSSDGLLEAARQEFMRWKRDVHETLVHGGFNRLAGVCSRTMMAAGYVVPDPTGRFDGLVVWELQMEDSLKGLRIIIAELESMTDGETL